MDAASAAVSSTTAGLNGQVKKPRVCENLICPKQYVETGNEPKKFWTRRQLHGNKYSWLCDVCSFAYNIKQFCDYCKQIYSDESEYQGANDGKQWVQCDGCNKWNHTDCEIERNNNLALKQALAEDKEIPYFCTSCSKSVKTSKPHKQTKMVTQSHEQDEDVQM